VPALAEALGHPEPTVRGHAAWALGRIGGAQARAALLASRAREADARVLEEIERALTEAPTAGSPERRAYA
jgi:epoxyqueuosine reductase